jgi:hypothetical protein
VPIFPGDGGETDARQLLNTFLWAPPVALLIPLSLL